MLTDLEIKGMIETLLNLRDKLIWIIKQTPVNNEQIEHIEKGKKNLLTVNQMLGDFGVKLSNGQCHKSH